MPSKCGMVRMARKVTGLWMPRLVKEVSSSMAKVCCTLAFIMASWCLSVCLGGGFHLSSYYVCLFILFSLFIYFIYILFILFFIYLFIYCRIFTLLSYYLFFVYFIYLFIYCRIFTLLSYYLFFVYFCLFIYLYIVEYSPSFHIIFKTLDVHNCPDYIETLVSLQRLVMRILP